MKYRDISLNGDNGLQFDLVKYTDKYKVNLENFQNLDESLASCVEKFPRLYSELSDHQSYMIFKRNSFCIGVVYIGTSCDEKDLEVKIQLDESKFKSREEIFDVVNQIIDVLGLCFRDKNNIEVNVVNDIDLSEFDKKYKKMIYDANLTTYIFANKINGMKRVYKK